jgi:diguanylate cyclase (GGDEF)-like protein
MFAKIQTRLAVLYAGLFALALSFVAGALYLVVTSTAEHQVRDQLVASSTVFDRLWDMRSHELSNAAGVVARDFGFRAAVATGDEKTAKSALDNLKARLGLPIAFIVGMDGRVTGLADRAMRGDAAALWGALESGEQSGVAHLGGTPHQLVAAPIMAPALTGWVVFATELGAPELKSLERLSAIPITANVLQRNGEDMWSSGRAPADQRDARAIERLIETSVEAGEPGELNIAGGKSLALVKPLRSMGGGKPAVLLLRYPIARAMAAYQPLHAAVAVTGAIGLVLLLLGSWRLSLSITKPISALDRAARLMEEGEMVEVAVKTRDEIGRLAQSFNRMAAGIAERERQITRLAFNDSLTGLPNRAFMRQHLDLELQQAAHRGSGVALLCIDIDNFKAVNDSLGHSIGDKLLRAVADRLGTVIGDELIARLGGDEFTIVVAREAGAGPGAIAQQIISALAAPFDIDGHALAISVSAGIALSPADGRDADTLLKNADLALHQAKDAGQGSYCFFEKEMNARVQARHALENDLRRALSGHELELYFQPLFDLDTDRINAFEALLRWNHPTRGIISPAEFIPVAEETGLIVPIGNWVIQEACRHARSWPETIAVAVNVSSIQFRKPGLANTLMQALATNGLEPGRLEIEITESIFLDSSEETLAALHSLRALGIKIALDDFGTGYSSLSYLQSFPFDKIKIDRSFIQELLNRPGASAIVHAIIDLAHALGMETTAEGVEESAQLAQLRLHGCSSVQGFLFSRPVDATAALGLAKAASGHRQVA